MPGSIVVGLDGSAESHAAAEWAAREAELQGLPVRLVHAWEPVPGPMAQAPLLGVETHQHWTERIPREAAEGIRARHPGVEVATEQSTGTPADALLLASRDADLLALGSRALSGIGGYLVGSVGQSVIARALVPTVLVRAEEQVTDEHIRDPVGIPSAATAFRPVALGLDIRSADDTVVDFAFHEAELRGTAVHALNGWDLPAFCVHSLNAGVDLRDEIAREKRAGLTETLRPWRQKYPDVEVVEASRPGSPSDLLVEASHDASLLVVGRRVRHNPFGIHIGAVTHAVLHHAEAPVAVVSHE
ncbi:universal stress protein [Streptomyces flaveolus]|uniref:Universal stress protein n=1 Tax=Streptomyces flaveolus TaxID=67297 RepID=A0ABV1VBT9_9ACTN